MKRFLCCLGFHAWPRISARFLGEVVECKRGCGAMREAVYDGIEVFKVSWRRMRSGS